MTISPYVGAELTYDYELGVKEDWHHLRYGLEGAVNFLPIEFNSSGRYNATLSRQTDTYSYTPGTTPPTAPYQGSYGGPGFVINVPPASSTTTLVPGATFLAQQHFDAEPLGFSSRTGTWNCQFLKKWICSSLAALPWDRPRP